MKMYPWFPKITQFGLKPGSHLVIVLITRDAGELKSFRAELLEGAAVLE